MTFEITYDHEKRIAYSETKGEYDFDLISKMSYEIFNFLASADKKYSIIVDHSQTPLGDLGQGILDQVNELTKHLSNTNTTRIAIVVDKAKDLCFVSFWKSNASKSLKSQIDVFFTLDDAYEWIEFD